MRITLIAAVSENGIMGRENGGIPWALPRDTAHFRSYTAGQWLLLGRSTYEEMLGWFDDRIPIVVTRQEDYRPDNPRHRVAASPREGIELARRNGATECVVCGGASLYATTIGLADRLVLTRVDLPIDEGIRFPEIPSPSEWRLVHREPWPADEENEHGMVLEIRERQ